MRWRSLAFLSSLLAVGLGTACSRRPSQPSGKIATFGAPAGTSGSHDIQPDYGAWGRVKEGMIEDEVLGILGKPLRGLGNTRHGEEELYSWSYGSILGGSIVFPEPIGFDVLFKQGKVDAVVDPFDGVLSKDGVPTVPRPIIPHAHQAFDHFPRFVDFRWYPSSGKYPMRYEIQIDTKHPDEWYVERFAVEIPFHVDSFGGANKGRWRVRAVNGVGKSDWSEFRQFEFAQ